MKLPDNAIVNITHAEQVSRYVLKLAFSDGVERVVDFERFLKSSKNPSIRAYLSASKFAEFRVENGDLNWNDYDLCFPLADLYEGRI